MSAATTAPLKPVNATKTDTAFRIDFFFISFSYRWNFLSIAKEYLADHSAYYESTSDQPSGSHVALLDLFSMRLNQPVATGS
jgi:hypothetical protein